MGKNFFIQNKMKALKISLINPIIDKQELKLVSSCIKDSMLSFRGKFINKFEKKFEEFIGGGHATTTTNGTTAIELGLSTLGIKNGDEVIIPNFCFAAVINAVINVGAKPVLVDVDQSTWTIDPDEIKKNISKKTKAIIAVHTYGIICDIAKIKKIIDDRKIFILEDCAEALGSKIKNKTIGVQSDCSTFSFYANKTITTGEGGMVVFKNKEFFKRSLILRNQGRDPQDNSFLHIYKGFNFRMTNMQAALGYAQMFKIERFLKNKKKIFKVYNKYLSKNKSIIFLPVPKNTENSYWLYTIRLKNFSKKKRNLLIKKLKNKGIETRPGFYPLSEMTPYKKYSKKNYRNSKKIAFSSISLPTSSNLKEKDVISISKILLKELNDR